MKSYYISCLVLLSVVSCKPEIIDYVKYPDQPVVSIVEIDSTAFDRPAVEQSEIIRKFPFGPLKADVLPTRLLKIMANKKLYVEYKYDAEGKLVERTAYFSNGYLMGSSRYSYYAGAGIKTIENWTNIQLNNMESEPNTNELKLGSTEKFSDGYGIGQFDKVFQKAEDGPSYYSPETMQLGFDKNGQKIWEGATSNGSDFTYYLSFNRDSNGNVRSLKYRTRMGYENGYNIAYLYDNKRNPYQTTGDPADWRASSKNNVLSENFVSNQKNSSLTEYQYTYRTDGLPLTAIDSRAKESVLEFIYSN